MGFLQPLEDKDHKLTQRKGVCLRGCIPPTTTPPPTQAGGGGGGCMKEEDTSGIKVTKQLQATLAGAMKFMLRWVAALPT